RFGDDVEISLSDKQRPQPFSHDFVIVDDQESNCQNLFLPNQTNQFNDGSPAERRSYLYLAPDLVGALLHARQAESASTLFRLLFHPPPIVFDTKAHGVPFRMQCNPCLSSLSVLGDIIESFLGDAKELLLHRLGLLFVAGVVEAERREAEESR